MQSNCGFTVSDIDTFLIKQTGSYGSNTSVHICRSLSYHLCQPNRLRYLCKKGHFCFHPPWIVLEYLSLNLFWRKTFDESTSLSIHEIQLACQWQDTHRAIISLHHTHTNTYKCTGSCQTLRGVCQCTDEHVRKQVSVCEEPIMKVQKCVWFEDNNWTSSSNMIYL